MWLHDLQSLHAKSPFSLTDSTKALQNEVYYPLIILEVKLSRGLSILKVCTRQLYHYINLPGIQTG